ncbi:MAG TPA: hypothetical protein VFK42_15575 [Acidimicrobiales bacterium]|nr:hypothetical protein [Acidimicrobiales bacterium]
MIRRSAAGPSAPTRKVIRSYAPIAVVAAVFLLMAGVVHPIDRPVERELAAGQDSGAIAGGVPADAAPAAGGGTGASGAGGTVPTTGTGGGGVGAQTSGGGGGAGAGVQRCPDRAQQVPGDPYSPPCTTFSGDNGGATFQGVTGDTIVVAARELDSPTAGELFAEISGQHVITSPEAVRNTILAYAEYFSTHFDFYGRKIKIVFYKGQGNGSSEILGGGKEAALADSVKVDREIKAFADISAITLPYADALSQQGIVNFGAPYPSREWFARRRPFAWSNFPDGTNVVESAATALVARQGSGTADYAGGGLKGKKRVYGLVAPENEEYQESVSRYIDLLGPAGIKPAVNLKYKLDINSMPNQASNIIAQLKDAGVTTVLCGCDPVMLALGLTPKANEQNYQPEWLTAGLAFVDQDIVSQLIDQQQWSRAFGIAYNAESEALGGSFSYHAYKLIRPSDEPAFGYQELYYQLYMLAIGIQMAGPNLTPQTFEAGMFAYPGGQGPRGRWHFAPGDWTTTDDFREIWWDPNRVSSQNNRQGAWVTMFGGARRTRDGMPAGPAPYFEG